MSGLSGERREALANMIPLGFGPNDPYRNVYEAAEALAPLIAGWLAEAWDEGVKHCEDIAGVGYNDPGATWPGGDANPYRGQA